MKKLAKIREYDKENGKVIYLVMNTKTLELKASNGEYVDFTSPNKLEMEVMIYVFKQWGTWRTFEWIEN